jgi:predicted porin
MKKLKYAMQFAIPVFFAGTGSAFAQSSVTLYGIVDAGFTFNSNSNSKGQRLLSMTSSNEGSNRYGFLGREDLGGGLSAIFTIEGGFSTVTGKMGNNGTLFGRQAYVGLQSSQFGTTTLGIQYSEAFVTVGPMTAGDTWAASGASYGAHPGDIDNLDSTNRITNAIKYQSRDYNGFKFGGLYSFGGKAGAFSQNAISELAASYAYGPAKFAVGYTFAKDPNYAFWGDKALDSTTAINIYTPVIYGYASAGSEQIVSAGTTYEIGKAVVGAVYSNVQFQNLGSVAVAGLNATERGYRGTAALNTGELNVRYKVTPSWLLGLAYIFTKNNGAGGLGTARYQQVDVGTVYSLSRATALYAVGVYQMAKGTDSTGNRAVADIAGTAGSSNQRQFVATIGINHRF